MGTFTKAYDTSAKALVLTWDGYSTGDDVPGFTVPGQIGLLGYMQTFNAPTTVVLHGSADGTRFDAITSPAGDTVSVSGDGSVEFNSAARQIKPAITGTGTKVIVILRGSE